MLTMLVLLKVLEGEDNSEEIRRVTRKITVAVEPVDKEKIKSEKKENIFITTCANKYTERFLIYSVKYFYPIFYLMFLIGYFLYYITI